MAEEIDSLEQGERARKWMQQNGSAIVIGVLAAVAILMGYEAFKNRSINHRGEAGERYVELNTALANKEAERANALISTISETYADTPYAALAKLEAADLALTSGKIADAIAATENAVKLATTPPLMDAARLRLARLQLADGKADAALRTLDTLKTAGFTALAAELRGDVLLSTGKAAEALSAYNTALVGMDAGAPGRSTLQHKIDDLSGS
jgi:predicted negative regulator of RcsB-dependent stress response